MASQAIRFGEYLNYTNLYSAQLPQVQLNAAFLYVSSNKLPKTVFSKSVQILKQRQIPIKCILQQMSTQQKLISSLKLTPEKRRIQRKESGGYEPMLRSIDILSSEKKAYQTSKNQIKKIAVEDKNSSVSDQAVKLKDFNMQTDNQDKIKPPTASKRMGCGWSSKAQSSRTPTQVSQPKKSNRWWDKCTQLCTGDNVMNQTDKYEVQAPEKQLRKLINSKNVPSFTKVSNLN